MEGNVFMEQWNEYLEALASKAPTPGGGSAAAVYGAIGTALGEMVGNLTSGKKKFAIYEEDVQKILARLGGARMDFIRLTLRFRLSLDRGSHPASGFFWMIFYTRKRRITA